MRWSVAQFIGAALGGMCLALLLLQMHPAPPLAQLMVALMFMSVPYVLARRARGRAPDQDRGAAARGGRLPGAGHARRAPVYQCPANGWHRTARAAG
ncbi:hypothetical protein LP419_18170 [Massilia sp. H-1]|nr:hypothetical protein LP419_18170 [Massilia sp. H-1]